MISSIGDTAGLITTSSPALTESTPSPTASTTPATSHPGTWGKGGFGSPLVTHRSMWFSALATTFTRTSPGPGSGMPIVPQRYVPGDSSRIHASIAATVDELPPVAATRAIYARSADTSEGRGSSRAPTQRRVSSSSAQRRHFDRADAADVARPRITPFDHD